MSYAEILERLDCYGNHLAWVVDLEAPGRLPDGWQYVTENNCYTGWSGGRDCIRWAKVIRTEDVVVPEFAEIIERTDHQGNHFAWVVDLDACRPLPEGWEYVRDEHDQHSGWSGGRGYIRWAEVVRSDELDD